MNATVYHGLRYEIPDFERDDINGKNINFFGRIWALGVSTGQKHSEFVLFIKPLFTGTFDLYPEEVITRVNNAIIYLFATGNGYHETSFYGLTVET